MRFLILLVSALFLVNPAAATNGITTIPAPAESVSSSMLSVEKRVREASVKVTKPFTGGHGQNTKTDREQRRAHGDPGRARTADRVATGDVTRLMPDHALDLQRGIRSDNKAGMKVNILTVRHERIQ